MQTVEITIVGGAVQYVEFPRGVRVIIRDYDVEGTDEGDTQFDIRRDEQNDLYEHSEYIHDEDKTSGSDEPHAEIAAHATVQVDLSKVDWALLRKQKEALITASAALGKRQPFAALKQLDTDAFEGLLNLLDHLQDSAATTLGEETVFGPPQEPSEK